MDLSDRNKQWLADRLIESKGMSTLKRRVGVVCKEDTDIPASYTFDEAKVLLEERQKEIEDGKFVALDAFVKEFATW